MRRRIWITGVRWTEDVPEDVPDEPKETDEVLFEFAMERFSVQMDRIDGLDAKAAGVLSFSSAVFPIFTGLFMTSANTLGVVATVLWALGFAFYLGLVYHTYHAFRVTEWSTRPDLAMLRAYRDQLTKGALQAWVARECLDAIETNEPRIHQKATGLQRAIILLLAQTVLLSLAAIATNAK